METIYFKEHECHTYGSLPAVGQKAPDFKLVTPDLKEVKNADYIGKRVVLNIFPSLDTPVCAASVRRFNQEMSKLENTEVLCVSMDLPFAAGRFCVAEGLERGTPASAFRSPEFVKNYGVQIVDGPLAGLLARAVVVIDSNGKVIYSDLVRNITEEPHYAEVVGVINRWPQEPCLPYS